MDSPGVVVLLGVIALSSVVQGALLIALTWGGLQLTRRLHDLQVRVDRELRPALETLAQVSRNVAEVSDLAVLQVRRVESALAGTLDRVDDVRAQLRWLIRRPAGAIGGLTAMVRGLRRGFDVYQRLGAHNARSAGRRRSYREDEHLFI